MHIFENFKDISSESKRFYRNQLKNVLASACLCHDIGNPAFGHSGEDAIVSFFSKNKDKLSNKFSEIEYSDFLNFEGNANSIRVLTQQLKGKLNGGMKLTYSTLSAISKYPCEARCKDEDQIHRKKFGFLQSEKETFEKIAYETGMIKDKSINEISYYRHPFVWLTEVADDICYYIIDLEDAQRLKIIETKVCESYLIELISCLGKEDMQIINSNLLTITDANERISYLRSKSINSLIFEAFEIYKINFPEILAGTHKKPIFDMISDNCGAVKKIVEIENAGYNVMYQLLKQFVFPILEEKKSKSDKKAIKLIPNQYQTESNSNYEKVLGVIDYLSGMTDLYATELYRKIKGIEIGMRN
jgi:dGTPase